MRVTRIDGKGSREKRERGRADLARRSPGSSFMQTRQLNEFVQAETECFVVSGKNTTLQQGS